MSLAVLSFTHAALDSLAQASGYPDAHEALIDFTTEPCELLGRRVGGAIANTEGKDWVDPEWQHTRGFSYDSDATPGAGRTNAEINATRSRHPATEHIRQYRAAGFSAAEQAELLNRQFGTKAYTANRVTKIAHNMSLCTPGKMPRKWSRRKVGDRSPQEVAKRAANRAASA